MLRILISIYITGFIIATLWDISHAYFLESKPNLILLVLNILWPFKILAVLFAIIGDKLGLW